MAMYKIECRNCEYVEEFQGTIEEYEKKIESSCPNCGQINLRRVFDDGGSISFMDSRKLGVRKPDREFRNLLSTIKKENAGRGKIERLAD